MEFVTVQSAAAELNVHPDTIVKAIQRGDILAEKFGRQWAIYRASLDKFKANPPQRGRPPQKSPPSHAENETGKTSAE